MKNYQITEYNWESGVSREVIGAESAAIALQLADSIPTACKDWPTLPAEHQEDKESSMLADPEDEHHCWAADEI